jgi:hypothetical protein
MRYSEYGDNKSFAKRHSITPPKPLLSTLQRGATPCYHCTLIKRGKTHSLINTWRHVENVW